MVDQDKVSCVGAPETQHIQINLHINRHYCKGKTVDPTLNARVTINRASEIVQLIGSYSIKIFHFRLCRHTYVAKLHNKR